MHYDETRSSSMKSTKFWIIVISAALVLSGISAAAVLSWRGSGEVACIYQDGVLLRKIHLDTVTAPYTFTVTWTDGQKNTVLVEPGRICVSHADCPDQICVRTGWLSDGLTPIVCLPNHLSIRIQSKTSDAAVQ